MALPKPFSSLWPEGIETLIGALSSAGFRDLSATQLARKNFSQIKAPVSLAALKSLSPAEKSSRFSFLKKDAAFDVDHLNGIGLLIVDAAMISKVPETLPLLFTTYPDAALDWILGQSFPAEWCGQSEKVPAGVIAEGAVHIGPECEIGEGTVLESGVRLGARVRIGKNCRIGAWTRIGDDSVLGSDCRLTGLNSLGSQGFGTLTYPGVERPVIRNHVGRVILGDHVRLGAYVSIDRGVLDDTVVGSGTCFDNHVQVGHNCEIGEASLFCSFVGLSGSTKIGHHSIFAGMSGTKDHVRIGNHVVVAAQSGVSCDLEDGVQVKGYPPRPLREALKIQSLVTRLPELFDRLKIIEKKSKESP